MDAIGFLGLFIWWIVQGLIGGLIGKSKGLEGYGWVMGLLLGMIGWIIVACSSPAGTTCPMCKNIIKEGASRCSCGYSLRKINLPTRIAVKKPYCKFRCRYCNQSLEAESIRVGELIECPNCHKTIEIENGY